MMHNLNHGVKNGTLTKNLAFNTDMFYKDNEDVISSNSKVSAILSQARSNRGLPALMLDTTQPLDEPSARHGTIYSKASDAAGFFETSSARVMAGDGVQKMQVRLASQADIEEATVGNPISDTFEFEEPGLQYPAGCRMFWFMCYEGGCCRNTAKETNDADDLESQDSSVRPILAPKDKTAQRKLLLKHLKDSEQQEFLHQELHSASDAQSSYMGDIPTLIRLAGSSDTSRF